MGGFGSGCFMRLHRRTKVEELWRFDYAELHRWGAFSGRSGFYRIEGREVAFIAEGPHILFAWQEPGREFTKPGSRSLLRQPHSTASGNGSVVRRVTSPAGCSIPSGSPVVVASISVTPRRAKRADGEQAGRLNGSSAGSVEVVTTPRCRASPKMRWETYEALALRHALLEAEWIERTEKVLCWQRDSR